MIVRPSQSINQPGQALRLICILALLLGGTPWAWMAEVAAPAQDVPVIATVDVIVLGGSSAAVSAAIAAANDGATVFLVAGKYYLGEDLAGQYQLWLRPDEIPGSELAKAVFANASPGVALRPMQAKQALDQALLKAKVSFLFASYPTDVLRDASGRPAGVIIANRSGRQALIGKILIDASQRGTVARLAGAEASPFPAGSHQVRRVMVSTALPAQAVQVAAASSEEAKGVTFPIHEQTVTIPLRDGSIASFQEAGQLARDRTWDLSYVDAAEELLFDRLDVLHGVVHHDAPWSTVDELPVDAFRPRGVPGMYVLGPCADISATCAAMIARPLQAMELGTRIGRAASLEAKAAPRPDGVTLRAPLGAGALVAGTVQETVGHAGYRWPAEAMVHAEAQRVPVLDTFDVVVVGGGTGGAPAAIAAGRSGARTLVVEYLNQLGGVGTSGLISLYFHGFRKGFTEEIDNGVRAFDPAAAAATKSGTRGWNPDRKAEWYRQEMRKAGVTVWFGVMGIGAVVDHGRVRGVEIAGPHGRGVVLASVVIDATGSADIAAAAGAPCSRPEATEIAVQGTGVSIRRIPAAFNNQDFTYVDETDVVDVWRVLIQAREKFSASYDLGQLIDTRERQRIYGDVEVSPLDAMNGRTWPDTINVAQSNFDSHGYYIHPLFVLRPPSHGAEDFRVPIPYRSLLPKGLDGIIVTGVGGSFHRDALPLVRMQADVQNQGYAMGLAAATLARNGAATRSLDVRALQRQLVEKGILPPEALSWGDSFPLSQEAVAKAVETVADEGKGMEALLTRPEAALPLLRQALGTATTPARRLAYATILGMLGDRSGFDLLLDAVATTAWDQGWNFRTMGNFGASLSPLDTRIIALGGCTDRRAVPVLLAKLRSLQPDSDFSHIRSTYLALEALRDPAAAPALAEWLEKPGVAGHSIVSIAEIGKDLSAKRNDNATRRSQLIELGLARALYRCGDHQGLAKRILGTYAQDLHGHYARHAQAILADVR